MSRWNVLGACKRPPHSRIHHHHTLSGLFSSFNKSIRLSVTFRYRYYTYLCAHVHWRALLRDISHSTQNSLKFSNERNMCQRIKNNCNSFREKHAIRFRMRFEATLVLSLATESGRFYGHCRTAANTLPSSFEKNGHRCPDFDDLSGHPFDPLYTFSVSFRLTHRLQVQTINFWFCSCKCSINVRKCSWFSKFSTLFSLRVFLLARGWGWACRFFNEWDKLISNNISWPIFTIFSSPRKLIKKLLKFFKNSRKSLKIRKHRKLRINEKARKEKTKQRLNVSWYNWW